MGFGSHADETSRSENLLYTLIVQDDNMYTSYLSNQSIHLEKLTNTRHLPPEHDCFACISMPGKNEAELPLRSVVSLSTMATYMSSPEGHPTLRPSDAVRSQEFQHHPGISPITPGGKHLESCSLVFARDDEAHLWSTALFADVEGDIEDPFSHMLTGLCG